MGRSSSSCLKIITCVSDTAADEDLDLTAPESKASSDRRKWSFRKRSGRHRVLSNTATSEALSVVYSKESPEASIDSFHSPNILPAPEKDHIEEPPPLSSTVSPLFVSPLITTEDEVKDSDAVIIQSAIRGYCARRELLKLRNLVKLQAVVRGHLVRRQAAGTLRCVLAIVKMQALVRARQTRQINMERSSSSGNGISSMKTRPSTEKLLSNKFAHQLLESLPKTKHIPVKCDTSRSDSAWKWLERWMSVTNSDSIQQDEQTEEDTKLAAYGAPTEAPVAAVSISSELKPVPGEPNYDQDQSHLEDEGSDSLLPWQSNPKPSSKWASFEPQENEGDRPLFGSRKPLNPAFAAVQSKFEELSSASSLGRSANSESKSESLIVNSVENSQSHEPRTQIAISECGTEISISSTLDSPDRSEAEAGEIVLEIGSPRKNDSPNLVSMDTEAKNSSIEPEVHEPQVKQEPEEPTLSEMQAEMETPRSHATVPDLHGTPSSQVSNNSKAKKGAKAIRKQRAELIGKRSPSTPKDDSGGPKDSKMGKKRNSFGTAKPDHVDSEPRISCSSSTLPSYMQATESARAKALASISPKSSPDVHDKDSYPRKRHSLPIAANGKQGSSPRMQRSASQAQQVPKANGTPSPNNSAERRWQR